MRPINPLLDLVNAQKTKLRFSQNGNLILQQPISIVSKDLIVLSPNGRKNIKFNIFEGFNISFTVNRDLGPKKVCGTYLVRTGRCDANGGNQAPH